MTILLLVGTFRKNRVEFGAEAISSNIESPDDIFILLLTNHFLIIRELTKKGIIVPHKANGGLTEDSIIRLFDYPLEIVRKPYFL